MNTEDLDRFKNGMIQGTGAETGPNGRNLVGAINQIRRIATTLDRYGIDVSDLPDDERQTLADAQEDLQYHLDAITSHLGTLVGRDGSLDLPDGRTVDLPVPATSAAKQADAPDIAGDGGN